LKVNQMISNHDFKSIDFKSFPALHTAACLLWLHLAYILFSIIVDLFYFLIE